MSTALSVLRPRLLQEWDVGFQIPNANVDAFAAASLTSAFFLRDSNKDGNYYNKLTAGAFRPATATAADAWRMLNLLTNSSGLITQTGANYTDTTVGTETVEFWYYGIRPDTDVLNAINRGLEWIYWPAYEPLSLAADAAMRETGVTSWGTAASATVAKTSTAGSVRIYPGFLRSLTVTNTGANGYLPTANIGVTPSESLWVGSFGRLHSGTSAQLTLYDVTNAATFGQTITHTNSTFKFMWQQVNAPSGCNNINIRLGGTGASDVTDWCGLWVYRPSAMGPMVLPSYTDERFKLDALAYSSFSAGSVNNGVYEGLSLDMTEISRSEYSASFTPSAANPSWVQFHHSGYWDKPLWIQMRLPYSERGLYSTEASTCDAPLHLLIAASTAAFLDPVGVRKRVPNGEEMYASAVPKLEAVVRVRSAEGPAKRRADAGYRTMAN